MSTPPSRTPAAQRNYFRGWWKKKKDHDPLYERRRTLWRSYRMELATYEIMLKAQGGECAICGDPPPPNKFLHVDHDHKTGHVRGLLCNHCNVGLGHFRELVANLHAAIRYLESRGPKGPLAQAS